MEIETTVQDRMKIVHSISVIIFTGFILIGMVTCAIVDLAISQTLTWSPIPIISCIFSWFIFVPIFKYGTRAIVISLLATSILIVPFLLALDAVIEGSGQLLPIGIGSAIVAVVYLWVIFGLFKVLKTHKLIAAAIAVLLIVPANLMINVVLYWTLNEPVFDVWDAMSCLIVLAAAILLIVTHVSMQKMKQSPGA